MDYFQAETEFEGAGEEGRAPDVFRSDVGWVAQFASQNYLLKIDPYASQSYLSGYLPTPLSYDYYERHLYGLPQVTDFLALLYNKAELYKAVGTTSPPVTMDNFETDAIRVVRSRAAIYGFETEGTAYDALPFLYAFGGGMLDKDNKILVTDAGSVAGLNFLLKLQNQDKVMPAKVKFSGGPIGSAVTDFMKRKAAMIFGGPYNVSEILSSGYFKSHPDDLGVALIPTCPPGTPTCRAGQTGSPSGGQSYVISAGTKHPIEAYKFISFMSSKPSQIAIAEANQTLPTRISAYPAVSGKQFISKFAPLTKWVVNQPAIPQAGHLFDAFDPNIVAALDGVKTPIAALDAVADAWKQLLASS